ncbi:MAG: BLUF domain-containing protein [Planctomycetota bacterium]
MDTPPQTPLRHIVYRSTALGGPISDETLDAIRATAVRNNEELGITGFLMCEGESFLQLIEGPEEAIEKTFLRIRGDRRHGSIEVLLDGPCETRSVPAWAMGVFESDCGGGVVEEALRHPTLHADVRRALESVARRAA